MRQPQSKLTVLIAIPAVMVLALAARSSDDEEVTETSFTHSQYGSETTMTFTAVGDEIMEKTKTLKMARTNPAAAQNKPHNTFDPLVEGSQGIDWYDRSIEYGQTSATETVVIDYEVVDIIDLGATERPGCW